MYFDFDLYSTCYGHIRRLSLTKFHCFHTQFYGVSNGLLVAFWRANKRLKVKCQGMGGSVGGGLKGG